MAQQLKQFKSSRSWWFKCAALWFLLLILIISGVTFLVLRDVSFDVAGAVRAKSEELHFTTEIRDIRGRDLGVFSDETRFIVPYDKMIGLGLRCSAPQLRA